MLKPIDKIIEDKALIIPITNVNKNRKRLLNCFMVSEKGNPLILECIKAIMKVSDQDLKRHYCLILRVMQKAIEDKYEYEFFEKRDRSILPNNGDWYIYDKNDKKIAESRYSNYDQQKGFV